MAKCPFKLCWGEARGYVVGLDDPSPYVFEVSAWYADTQWSLDQ